MLGLQGLGDGGFAVGGFPIRGQHQGLWGLGSVFHHSGVWCCITPIINLYPKAQWPTTASRLSILVTCSLRLSSETKILQVLRLAGVFG